MRVTERNFKKEQKGKFVRSFILAFLFTSLVVSFQNCNGRVSFRPGDKDVPEGLDELASQSRNSGSISSDTASNGVPTSETGKSLESGQMMVSGLSVFKVGENYGSCTMQVAGNNMIEHNGAYFNTGVKIPTVPDGVGGATWPMLNCPYSGNYKSTQFKCADGFKETLLEYSQMDCRSNVAQAPCSTFWITHTCTRLPTGTVTPPTSASPSKDYPVGAIAGSCQQQLDANFLGVARSSPQSILTATTSTAVWPVVNCPENQSNTAVTCAPGWKLVTQSFTQFTCSGAAIGAMCNQYLVRSACAKL